MARSVCLCLMLMSVLSLGAQYVVSGGDGTPFLYEENQTNKNLEVYLLNGLSGAEVRYTSLQNTAHQWYRYKISASGDDVVAIPCEQEGRTSWIVPEDGYGYYVKNDDSQNTSQKYVWIIDYSLYKVDFQSISFDNTESSCDFLSLKFDMEAPVMTYNLPTGGRKEIDRVFSLEYTTLEFDSTTASFVSIPMTLELRNPSVGYDITPSPYENTIFTLTGDQFASHFGIEQKVESDEYVATAVKAAAIVETEVRDNDNEESVSVEGYGGSAPVDMTFKGYGNDPVAVLYIWKIYNKEEGPDNPLVRFLSEEVSYTFEHFGNFVAQLEVSNADGTCVDSVAFDITITESSLKIPNAFSPGTTPGRNDEFKVVYKSIVKFKGVIFNRWGVKVFDWNSPEQGWNGKYNGKYVPPGVYYYIIEAEGADGIKYNRQGDINVLRPKDINDTLPDDLNE